jgi:hypothetical protein
MTPEDLFNMFFGAGGMADDSVFARGPFGGQSELLSLPSVAHNTTHVITPKYSQRRLDQTASALTNTVEARPLGHKPPTPVPQKHRS